jgi:hypothetical protein
MPSVPITWGLFDALTIAIGVAVVLSKIGVRWWSRVTPIFSAGKCTVDLLNGSVIVPFGAMFLAPLQSTLFSVPLFNQFNSPPISIALAGGVGLFFIAEEISNLK